MVGASGWRPQRAFYASLLFQMAVAIAAGVVVGLAAPATGIALNAFAAGFIKLIRMIVGVLIFVTVAKGIARVGAAAHVGRLALLSLVYFELVTTVAFGWGALVGNVVRPGAGLHVDPATLDRAAIAPFSAQAGQGHTAIDFLLGLIPANPVSPFLESNVLQVLILALLFGFGASRTGSHRETLVDGLAAIERVTFAVVGFIMRLAPLAVFGAMAFVVGRYGLTTLVSLARLVATVYGACLVFIVVGFGLIARLGGFSLWKLVRYLREEVVLAFATASGETVLPRLVTKLEHAGCAPPVVGFVLPTGYSFNLDGGSIYLVIAALFIAQAFDVPLSLGDQLGIIGVLLLTTKGIAGVAGAGMVALASTLLLTPQIPLVGLALVLSVDRLSDPMRTVTNILGNAIATLLVARWTGGRDDARLACVLDRLPVETFGAPAAS